MARLGGVPERVGHDGTPKLNSESASHDAVRAVFVSGLEKCGKQEKAMENGDQK